MAELALPFMVASTVMSAAGSLQAGKAQARQARAQAAAQAFEAEQLRVNAGQERAAAQRAGIEQTREAQLVSSRILALAAAGGGGASDPTIMNLMAKTAGEGAYRSALALYQGEERARQMELGAVTRGAEAQNLLRGAKDSVNASRFAALTSVVRGGAQIAGSPMFDKYWAGPKAGIDPDAYNANLIP